MAIHLERTQIDDLSAQAAAAAPDECCGLLAGVRQAGDVRVREVHPVENVWDGDKRRRFMIEPLTHLRIQRECRERGLDIVGFYHSHPHGPATPSAFDAELAWPGASYVIVSLRDDQPGEVKSWVFDDAGEKFLSEDVSVVEDGGGS